MKTLHIISLVLLLAACSETAPKQEVAPIEQKPDSVKTVSVESFYIDENEINGGFEYKEYSHCDFDKFLNDPKTPQLAKDIYLDKDWKLDSDHLALALLDSLEAKNKASRPFYFKVVTLSMKKADGYYSEGLGNAGYRFIENQTQDFASYFDKYLCLTDQDLSAWAEAISLEIDFLIGSRSQQQIAEDYIQKLKVNCSDCTAAQKETIDRFAAHLRNFVE